MKLWNKNGDSRKNLMMLCLMAALILEFLFITLENLFGGLGYYLTETWIIVPALLFLGCSLSGELSGFAKRRLLLAGAAVSWFILVQQVHRISGMGNQPMATVLFVYLMAFPFASVSEDEGSTGLRGMGGMFLTAALILVGYTGILLSEMVPESLQQYLYWDGARLRVFWHPNITACFLMMGIAFAAAFLVQVKKMLYKVLLVISIALQMAVMSMTNCRTTLLMTGAMLGAVFFLMILQRFQPKLVRKPGKKNTKVILLCIALVLVVLVAFFLVAGKLYQWNNDRLLEEAGTDILQTENPQGTLLNDMRTLNGRTHIWKSAFSAVRDNKMLALFGTEYVGTVISVYNPFEVVHGHNSWVESLMRMGLPGLLMSLVFTAIALWSAAKLILNPAEQLWKKIIALLTLCLMATGFLEPYLFITNVYYHVTDFAFFFLTGYLDYWANKSTN